MEAREINDRLKRLAVTDRNAAVLLALRSGDVATTRAHAIAIHGRCPEGCTFWQCGREAGHAGPCQP